MDGNYRVSFVKGGRWYSYVIPQLWLAGYLRTHPDATVLSAVEHWHRQVEMGQAWEAERKGAEV